jgi:hypothetical protein
MPDVVRVVEHGVEVDLDALGLSNDRSGVPVSHACWASRCTMR